MTAAKSIIEIEISDGPFKEFKALFDEYQAQLKDLPGVWSKVGKAVQTAATDAEGLPGAMHDAAALSEDIVASFAAMTSSLMAQAEQHRRIAATEQAADAKRRKERDDEVKAEKDKAKAAGLYQQNVERTNRTIKETRQNVTGITKGIASAAVDVLKWVGIGGIASGLIGGGGLFGLDRLASSAGDSRRSAQGLDTSVGDLKAFKNNYDRAVDSGSFLSNIETVARTPGLQYGVGSDIARLSSQGNGTADIGAALIPLIKRDFLQNGGSATGMKASGLDNVVSLQEAIRISNLSDAEIAEIAAKYDKSKASLAVNDQVSKDWQDLAVQLGTAGDRIENVLIKDLDKLAPVINHLSDEAVDLVDKWTQKLVPAVDHLATYLDSEEFQGDLKAGAKAVKDFADGAIEAARTLGLIERPAPNPAASSNRDILQWNLRHPDAPLPLDPLRSQDDIRAPGQVSVNDKEAWRWWLPDSYGHHLPGTALWEKPTASADLVARIKYSENSGDNAVSPKGAMGAFQFMPETAKQYGLANPFDPKASAEAAGKMLADLSKEFGGDQRKVIAAYNWGSGNLGKDIAKYAGDWDKHLPAETQAYLARAESFPGAQSASQGQTERLGTTVVRIENNTGGSAVVSTSQFPS